MNTRMNLNEVIFTDGKILSYRPIDSGLAMKFQDYAGNALELRFTGHVVYEDRDGVGFDLADSKLMKAGDRFSLELFDDESVCVFRVGFDCGEYVTIRPDAD
jgi:hypothetical protein